MFALPRIFLVTVSIMNTFGHVVTFFSIILSIADVASDIILAVDYCVTDNPWWCGLTWAFVAVPLILAPFVLFGCFCREQDKQDHWKIWKGIEICFESGPQLLLQLYIMAITDLGPTAVSGKAIRIITTYC